MDRTLFWTTADLETKCYLPGVPRITYMPLPLQIVQSSNQITILYEYVHAVRYIFMTGSHPPGHIDWWMGDSRGRWEGETLVVDLVRSGLRFRLEHIPPDVPPDDVDVVLHGHTHVPRNEKRGVVLFLNPGCVTRPNQGSPASVAWLEIANGKISWKLVPLR